MEKVICNKTRWYSSTLNGTLDEEIMLMHAYDFDKNGNPIRKYFYQNRCGNGIIDAAEFNRLKIAQARQDQKVKEQQKWDKENTCPYCGMVLSTREAQNKECDNCGSVLC